MIRYIAIFLLFVLFISTFFNKTHAVSADVKGFIALDALKVVKRANKDTSFEAGLGALDLKIYATHENLTAKLKLDLDDSSIDEAYNIFEEANASYRFYDWLKFTAGKGQVPFHQKHWGVIEGAYVDGGSVLGSENSWRDQDNKIISLLQFGSKSRGFINSFTFYGDSQQIQKNREGQPEVDTSGSRPLFKTKRAQNFRTDDERGFANKLEFFVDDLTVYAAFIHYYNDVYPDESYAWDIGGRYKTKTMEIWFEAMHGFFSTHQNAKYVSRRQYENFFQLGSEWYINKLINVLCNFEFIRVNDNTWNWIKERDNNYKIDAGTKFKLKPNAFITLGALAEKKHSWVGSDKKSKDQAFEMATKFSFWF